LNFDSIFFKINNRFSEIICTFAALTDQIILSMETKTSFTNSLSSAPKVFLWGSVHPFHQLI
jgi:hypothetical protein